MTVDVLGTKYTIIESNKVKDDNLNKCDGYCDHSTKQIVIDTFQDCIPVPKTGRSICKGGCTMMKKGGEE